jgi:hypothetical protein
MLLVLAMLPAALVAEERLGFIAEHMIEVQSDARYLALPEIESPGVGDASRFDVGYLGASGGVFSSSALMLGLQHYFASTDQPSQGWMLGGFLDLIRFDGDSGDTTLDPQFASSFPFPVPLNITVQDISGDALHAGISLSFIKYTSPTLAWQTGLVLEYYSVNELKVNFTTRDLPANFDGFADYAADYHALTPFFSTRYFFPQQSENYRFSSRFVAAWPLPRRGFSGEVSGPGFDVSGNTDDAGNGTHIPDPFFGIGFTIEGKSPEDKSPGWRLDIGTSLWLYVFEGKTHEGIDPPIFIHFSLPLD